VTRLAWLRRSIAHRGLHDAARGVIENSSSAIEAAAAKGYAAEVDLRQAGDGEVMVFHDATLERLTEGSGPLGALTARQLRRIPFKGTGDRMQSLGELFDQVAGRVPLVLEVKSDWDGRQPFAARLAEVIAAYAGPVAVMSFDPHMIAAFRARDRRTPRGLVAERFADARHWRHHSALQRFLLRHLLMAGFARPHFIAYDVDALPALAPWAGRHLFGWPLLTWTVRTPEQRRRAERWADAMIFEGFEPRSSGRMGDQP